MTRTLVTAIVSTAAPGVERGALDAAIELAIGYGGRTDAAELPPIYVERMRKVADSRGMAVRLNTQDSDGTLIVTFADALEGRAKHAAGVAKQQRKPCQHLILPARGKTRITEAVRAALLEWIDERHVSVLHVVGPSEEQEPGIQQATHDALVWVLEDDGVADGQPTGAITDDLPPGATMEPWQPIWPESLQHVAQPEPITPERMAELAALVHATGGQPTHIPINPDNVDAALDAGLEVEIWLEDPGSDRHRVPHPKVAEFLESLECCPRPPTQADIDRLVDEFYKLEGNGAGGSLHVVLDDNNWERECVEHGKKWAAERGDIAGERFADLLLRLTDEQRRAWIGAGYCGTCAADFGDEHQTSPGFDTPDGRCPDCGAWPASKGASA